MALAARRAANGGPGGDGNGRAGGEFCYFVIHAVAWALAERGAPRGLRRLPKPSSSRPYRGWVARCKTSSSQVANLALAHLRLLVGAAAQVAEARTGFLDAQDER
jgi:hypothetical protein